MKKLILFVTVITASMTSHAFSMESFEQEKEKENSVCSKRPISKTSKGNPLSTKEGVIEQIESAEALHAKSLEGVEEKLKILTPSSPNYGSTVIHKAQIIAEHKEDMKKLTSKLCIFSEQEAIERQIESSEESHQNFLQGVNTQINSLPMDDLNRERMATFKAQLQKAHINKVKDLTSQIGAIKNTLTK